MQTKISSSFLIDVLVLFLISGLFFGNYFFYAENLRLKKENNGLISSLKTEKVLRSKEKEQSKSEIATLKNEIENWKNKFYTEEDEKDEWKDKYKENEELFDKVGGKLKKLFGTVDTIVKIQNTDKELLSKYSKEYFLNEHYTPKKLTWIKEKYLHNKNKPLQINSNIEKYLNEMIEEADGDNINLKLISAYRSYEYQKNLKSRNVAIYGKANADALVADQGLSEHQLGTTIDFINSETGKLIGFNQTKEYKWLKNNAYKYGFIISYPEENKYYEYEPWHWRFVGKKLAKYLHRNDKYFYEVDQRKINEYIEYFFE